MKDACFYASFRICILFVAFFVQWFKIFHCFFRTSAAAGLLSGNLFTAAGFFGGSLFAAASLFTAASFFGGSLFAAASLFTAASFLGGSLFTAAGFLSGSFFSASAAASFFDFTVTGNVLGFLDAVEIIGDARDKFIVTVLGCEIDCCGSSGACSCNG